MQADSSVDGLHRGQIAYREREANFRQGETSRQISDNNERQERLTAARARQIEIENNRAIASQRQRQEELNRRLEEEQERRDDERLSQFIEQFHCQQAAEGNNMEEERDEAAAAAYEAARAAENAARLAQEAADAEILALALAQEAADAEAQAQAQGEAQQQYNLPIGRKAYEEPTNRFSLGPMNVECQHCHALHWDAEKLTASPHNEPRFGLCCLQGQVKLPPFPQPPVLLRNLLCGISPFSETF